jgi:hypothetical protein
LRVEAADRDAAAIQIAETLENFYS